MNEIVWRVKKGWVYLVGIALMIGFSALAYGEIDVKTAKENGESPKKETSSETLVAGDIKRATAGVNEAPNPSTTTKPEEKKTRTKTIYKIVTVEQSKTVTSASNTAPATTATKPPVKKDTVKLVITNLGTYEVEVKEGDNAFEVTKRAANQNGFMFEYKQYSWGIMITKIGNLGAEWPTWWELLHNGSSSMVGASDLQVNKDDIIEWRFNS